jgi:Cof subfamily protein (haloacid dehalogenase superfamily)
MAGSATAGDPRPAGAPRVRLVALDLDGTLLTRGNAISDANAAAVRDAVAAGMHVVFATSRWYRLAKATAGLLGVTAPIICHNGAMIRDPRDDAVILRHDIAPDAAREVARLADDARYESIVTVRDETWMTTKRADIDPARLPAGMRLSRTLSEHVGDGAEAFLFFGQDAVDGLRAALGDRYDGVLTLAWGFSETFPPYLNIVNAAADKGRALRLVCDRLGVPLDETMAIGDAAPDLDMMRVAGLSVAMGNAPSDVQAQATVTGPGNREDGVAWAIRRFALPAPPPSG